MDGEREWGWDVLRAWMNAGEGETPGRSRRNAAPEPVETKTDGIDGECYAGGKHSADSGIADPHPNEVKDDGKGPAQPGRDARPRP